MNWEIGEEKLIKFKIPLIILFLGLTFFFKFPFFKDSKPREKYLSGGEIRKVIFVPGKLINFVV